MAIVWLRTSLNVTAAPPRVWSRCASTAAYHTRAPYGASKKFKRYFATASPAAHPQGMVSGGGYASKTRALCPPASPLHATVVGRGGTPAYLRAALLSAMKVMSA